MATAFTWMHLTDLHVGQPRHQYNPDQILSMLIEDLKELREDPGLPLPDVVFFTGDLAFSGAAAQYDKLEAFLGRLWRWFGEHGDRTPVLAPVPGNHDLVWQDLDRDQRVLWRSFHDGGGEVRDQLFESRRAGLGLKPPAARAEPIYWLDAIVERAFSAYVAWLARTKIPLIGGRTPGLLPGEYAATWEGGGLRVGVLGLNSAYYDLPLVRPRPGEGMLALYADQLDAAAAPDDFDTWCAARNACVVLSHHPPRWLAEAGTIRLRESYFTGDRVALHLSGHVHVKTEGRWGEGWSEETLSYLGTSLFGVERFEGASEKAGPRRAEAETDLLRSFGYSLGQLRFTPGSAEAEVVVYPRRAVFEDRMRMRPDRGTDNRTKALATKHVEVRPLPAPLAPAPAPVVELRPPAPGTFRRPIFDEILAELRATSPTRSGNVFVFAPTRYGATTLVDTLVEDARARRGAEGTETLLFVVVRLGAKADVNQVEARICDAIQDALDRDDRAQTSPGTLAEYVEEVLRQRPAGTILVLVLESFSSLPDAVSGPLQSRLRSAMESNRYSTSRRRGLRFLLVGRAPADQTFSATVAGSPLAPALHFVTLGPLSPDEAEQCAAGHAAWRGCDDAVRWLWRHTGGHPQVYIRLCVALAEVASAWPPSLRGLASDEERSAWLHGLSCPVKQDVDDLATVMKQVLRQYAGRLPAPWGALPASVAQADRCAVEKSGLFLPQTSPPVIIPFVARAIARP